MPRYFPPIRLLLACLLFIGAGMVHYLWPLQMRWKAPCAGKVIGISEQKLQPIVISGQNFPKNSFGRCTFVSTERQPLQISAFDMENQSTQELASFYTSPNVFFLTQLSPRAKYLAVVKHAIQEPASEVCLVDLEKREQLFRLENNLDVLDITFSQDDQFIAVVTLQKVLVWNIQTKTLVHDYDSPAPAINNANPDLEDFWYSLFGKCPATFSENNRWLAVVKKKKLKIYDLEQNAVLPEKECHGYPLFVDDGSLIVAPDSDWRSNMKLYRFQIHSDGLINCDQSEREHHPDEVGLATFGQSYLTARYQSGAFSCPQWMPNWMSSVLENNWPPKLSYWLLSLRDAQAGDMVRTLSVRVSEEKVMRDFLCGNASQTVEISNLHAVASRDHKWLILQNRNNIELWPLLTWWRPSACWWTIGAMAILGLLMCMPRRPIRKCFVKHGLVAP